jgi:hypothetical protein
MNNKQIAIVVFINLIIAVGFFIENLNVGFSELSTDSQNAIPICYKINDQSLFQKDLYLSDLENVKYYTPFYIDTIRFFSKISDGDYILAINLFSTFLHLIYGFLWFYLFYLYFNKNFWIALLLSIIIRGIVWLPGYEIWGISDLWTMMPRTYYTTFLPLPFILLYSGTKKSFFISCFLIGFILNLHPITGIGGLLLFFSLILGYNYFYSKKNQFNILWKGFIMIIIGILPFVITYFSKTNSAIDYSIQDYKIAFRYRIPEFFGEPITFLKTWIKPKILFYFIPLIFYAFYTKYFKVDDFKKAKILIFITLVTIIIPTISVYFELFINETFHKNIRMSFQIIRSQKLAILPGFFALGFLLVEFINIKFLPKLSVSFIVAIAISKLAMFDKIPFFGDDISRSVFPSLNYILLPDSERKTELDKMSEFIKLNTNKNDVFYNDFILRSAAERSVILDGKGASMLIEGNPKYLIKWYKEISELKSKKNFIDSIQYIKERGANYFISNKRYNDTLVKFIHKEGALNLYRIN